MLGQGKPKESLGWLPAPSRPASSSRGGGVLERTTHFLCCPNPRAFAMLAPHETLFRWPKKALISPLGPLPISLCCRRYGGPVPEGTISSQRPSLDKKLNRRAITYSPFLCWALPRNENGRHHRMLHICCPGVYPGVLLWPICHPYILGGAPSRVENAPLRHGLVCYSRSSDNIRTRPPLL
ncbi:unnamed protein product [Victoria cruziana]